jgi:hypothetical protein
MFVVLSEHCTVIIDHLMSYVNRYHRVSFPLLQELSKAGYFC